jgi:hypothetical protein
MLKDGESVILNPKLIGATEKGNVIAVSKGLLRKYFKFVYMLFFLWIILALWGAFLFQSKEIDTLIPTVQLHLQNTVEAFASLKEVYEPSWTKYLSKTYLDGNYVAVPLHGFGEHTRTESDKEALMGGWTLRFLWNVY